MAAPTLLIVDDDKFVRDLLRDQITSIGFECRLCEASDGVEAISAAREQKPNLVFLDLFMPNKSGLEALPEVLKAAPGAKVVVISSMDSEALVAQALKDGAAAFIAKPFHPDEIAATVKRLLK